MELFKLGENVKLLSEIAKKKEFKENGYRIEEVSANDDSVDYEKLQEIKILFQKMLPKMPKEYVMRQIMDKKQCCVVMYRPNDEIIGVCCYRPVFDRNFIEIVFFAVNSLTHIKGYGAFVMNCTKEIVKRQYLHYKTDPDNFMKNNVVIEDIGFMTENNIKYDPEIFIKPNSNVKKVKLDDVYNKNTNIYMLTYADNSAVGFFKKQGFESSISSVAWKGYIKDYDGGTLMECKLYKEINYLNQMELILELNEKVFEKMKEVNSYHVVRQSNDVKLRELTEEPFHQTKEGFLTNFIKFCISELYASPSSWPFLEPVSIKEVPEYFSVIHSPMDLSTIKNKHLAEEYLTFDAFKSDVLLMVQNCMTFNGKHTQYYKCAENINDTFEAIYKKHKSTINKYL